LTRFQVQAKVVVPLLLTDQADAAATVAPAVILPQLWGLLVVHQCAATRQWQPFETALLQQVAVHLGIALQQAELSHHLQQLNQTLEAQVQQRTAALQQQLRFESLLKQITDQVRDSLDETHILQAAVTALGQGLAVDCCDTGLYDLERQHSTVTYEYTSVLSSVLGQVVSLQHPSDVYVQLLAGQTLQFCWVSTDVLRQLDYSHAILACPLQDDQGVFGDLWLFRAHGEAFSEPEVRLVQQVANQCAIALRQARLYADSQQQLHVVEQLNRLKDDFLSTVSHELRTPLASIKMATHMLSLSFEQCEPPFTIAYGVVLANKVWQY
jgi:GAF domain-containing protein